jgi:hypothetical protein
VPREDTRPASASGPEQKTAQPQAAPQQSVPQQGAPDLSALTDQERAVLEILVASATARTAAQLSAASGLPREQVASALESLRVKGVVTLLNTVIESYGARFPGLDLG